jgi:hypothetical protein
MISLRDVWSFGVVRGGKHRVAQSLGSLFDVCCSAWARKNLFEAVDIVLSIFIPFSKMKHSSPREIKILECVVG